MSEYEPNVKKVTTETVDGKTVRHGMPKPAPKVKEFVEVTVRLPVPAEGEEWEFNEKGKYFFAKPIRKLLDWSKVGPDVLVYDKEDYLTPRTNTPRPTDIYNGWQAHLGGECPVDENACMVEVVTKDDRVWDGFAREFTWCVDGTSSDITRYRVTSLAPGYEYP